MNDETVEILEQKFAKIRESFEKQQEHINYLIEANRMMREDIRLLLCNWFSSLEDEGVNPWDNDVCVAWANKYSYTKEMYTEHLKKIL